MYSNGPSSAFDSETFGEDLSFHIEQPVGSMSISPCGRDVVLASKEGLHIIDLDSPYSPPRYLPHPTSWEVADVQWSPFSVRDYWVISTSNQKALVWNLGARSWQDSVEFVLHGHSRAITDINFSAHHPDVLATCAVDSFVHCWDLRVPARPVISFSDWFAGATQVKWSRQESHVVASSHDKYLRIWDDRMGAHPVRSIKAHDTKIYGIDWNRYERNRIVTCSLNKKIKFWDCNNPEDVPERVINTPFPVWRARHTPFGQAIVAMPQRGDSDLHLYDRRDTVEQYPVGAIPAVARFEGHRGQVREFLWRPRGSIADGIDHREFQLVTWGADQELRLHRMLPKTLSAVGYEKGLTTAPRQNLSRRGAKYRTFRDQPIGDLYPEVFDSQTGSSPATGQSFHSRHRPSTGVGMSKPTTSRTQGWFQGSDAISRTGMHGKANARQLANPIDWMKNVKLTSWNSETLGEEISSVGEKFTKVAFESVDVTQRKAVVSMHAAWGNLNTPIFLKLDMKFPVCYPRQAAPIFNVQKTAEMTDELTSLLSTELRTIGETFLARKRGCLEAVLWYLLREQELKQIVSWALDETLDDSKIFDPVDFTGDISSDEDDVGADNFQGPQGMINSSELLNANVLVPVPRGCGASWADDGKLVCFFPPKSKPPTSFFELFGAWNNDGAKSDKVFEGLGRLQTDSPSARTALRTLTSREGDDSEPSDNSSFSSSSSSNYSDNITSLPSHFFPRSAWRGVGGALPRSKSGDQSTQSVNAVSKSRLGLNSVDNIVSIHEVSDLIPSKRALAAEYILFGKATEVCCHNTEVAARHGQNEIARVWNLVGMILQNDVPLESVSGPPGSTDILTVARLASDATKSNDSGVDLTFDKVSKRPKGERTGRILWGESAFGGSYLVPALFEHFERLGDVQMLAMLSCIFAESKGSSQQQRPGEMSIPLEVPSFSVDYHPSLEIAQSEVFKAPTTSFPSANSAVRLSDPNATMPPSTEITPPNLVQHPSHQSAGRRRSFRLSRTESRGLTHRDSASTIHSGIGSLSTSPEGTRIMPRSNQNLAFSLSRASLSALTSSFSHSPPTVGSGSGGNKGSSPVGSLIGQHVNTGAWSAASIFGGAGPGRGKVEIPAQTTRSRQNSSRLGPAVASIGQPHSLSSDGDGAERNHRGGHFSKVTVRHGANTLTSVNPYCRTGTKRKIKIKSALHNQTMFDHDGYARVPLLESGAEWRYRAYRVHYAHLLEVWSLQTQRVEMLKINGLVGDFVSFYGKPAAIGHLPNDDELPLSHVIRRKNLSLATEDVEQKQGLRIRRLCSHCGELLQGIEKNRIAVSWHCTTCEVRKTRSSHKTMCAICTRSISGLMVPCLSCGHVSCFKCHQQWLARASSYGMTDDEATGLDLFDAKVIRCPAGCDCTCSAHQYVRAPDPPTSEEEDGGGEKDDDDDEWEEDAASFLPPPATAPATTSAALEAAKLLAAHGPNTPLGAFLALSRVHSSAERGKKRSTFTDRSRFSGRREIGGDGVDTPSNAKAETGGDPRTNTNTNTNPDITAPVTTNKPRAGSASTKKSASEMSTQRERDHREREHRQRQRQRQRQRRRTGGSQTDLEEE